MSSVFAERLNKALAYIVEAEDEDDSIEADDEEEEEIDEKEVISKEEEGEVPTPEDEKAEAAALKKQYMKEPMVVAPEHRPTFKEPDMDGGRTTNDLALTRFPAGMPDWAIEKYIEDKNFDEVGFRKSALEGTINNYRIQRRAEEEIEDEPDDDIDKKIEAEIEKEIEELTASGGLNKFCIKVDEEERNASFNDIVLKKKKIHPAWTDMEILNALYPLIRHVVRPYTGSKFTKIQDTRDNVHAALEGMQNVVVKVLHAIKSDRDRGDHYLAWIITQMRGGASGGLGATAIDRLASGYLGKLKKLSRPGEVDALIATLPPEDTETDNPRKPIEGNKWGRHTPMLYQFSIKIKDLLTRYHDSDAGTEQRKELTRDIKFLRMEISDKQEDLKGGVGGKVPGPLTGSYDTINTPHSGTPLARYLRDVLNLGNVAPNIFEQRFDELIEKEANRGGPPDEPDSDMWEDLKYRVENDIATEREKNTFERYQLSEKAAKLADIFLGSVRVRNDARISQSPVAVINSTQRTVDTNRQEIIDLLSDIGDRDAFRREHKRAEVLIHNKETGEVGENPGLPFTRSRIDELPETIESKALVKKILDYGLKGVPRVATEVVDTEVEEPVRDPDTGRIVRNEKGEPQTTTRVVQKIYPKMEVNPETGKPEAVIASYISGGQKTLYPPVKFSEVEFRALIRAFGLADYPGRGVGSMDVEYYNDRYEGYYNALVNTIGNLENYVKIAPLSMHEAKLLFDIAARGGRKNTDDHHEYKTVYRELKDLYAAKIKAGQAPGIPIWVSNEEEADKLAHLFSSSDWIRKGCPQMKTSEIFREFTKTTHTQHWHNPKIGEKDRFGTLLINSKKEDDVSTAGNLLVDLIGRPEQYSSDEYRREHISSGRLEPDSKVARVVRALQAIYGISFNTGKPGSGEVQYHDKEAEKAEKERKKRENERKAALKVAANRDKAARAAKKKKKPSGPKKSGIEDSISHSSEAIIVEAMWKLWQIANNLAERAVLMESVDDIDLGLLLNIRDVAAKRIIDIINNNL